MKYTEYINSPIFWMKRRNNSRVLSIFKMNCLLTQMIWDRRIEIWQRQESLSDNGYTVINSTPKLRKMMRIR